MTNTKFDRAFIAFAPDVEVVTPLINLFKVCPDSSVDTRDTAKIVNEAAMVKGYLIDPNCDMHYAAAFINSIDMQYNSTFYKTWSEVSNKTRFELLVDQILHYMSTYGTDFEGEPYLPNTNPDEPDWLSYTTISLCSWECLYDRCMNMLVSGIALKSSTVKVLTDYIIEYVKFFEIEPIIDEIKNREALVILCDALGILPNDGQKLFAHIMYKATGQTMIVKNRATRNVIECNIPKVEKLFITLNQKQLIALAGVFNRYKELFLAFKNPLTKNVINKIGRLSKKHHIPMVRTFWQDVFNMSIEDFNEGAEYWLPKATNFKLVQIMQAVRERLMVAAGEGSNLYIIRNGKIFAKNTNDGVDTLGAANKYIAWQNVYLKCRAQLVENLKTKACAVKFPEHYTLMCPTSEKNFVGDFPMGTSCKLGPESVVGIYWRNDWGTRDFDLSYQGLDGTSISWCTDYHKNDKIIYSGDLTDATNGANEVIRFNDDIVTGIMYVNQYWGDQNSKFRLFLGTDNNNAPFKQDMSKYMVDPNNLKLETELTFEDGRQFTLGLVHDGYFYFFTLGCGYSAIKNALSIKNSKDKDIRGMDWNARGAINKEAEDELITILKRKIKTLLPLNDVLLEAGFWSATEDDENVLDLTSIDRGSLIELFTK